MLDLVPALRKAQWNAICRSLRDQRAVLVLGPNLLSDGNGMTFMQAFANYLKEELEKDEYDSKEESNMPYIASRVLSCVDGYVKEDLWSEYAGFMYERMDVIPDIYWELADLPFNFVLNTAADNFIYQSFLSSGDPIKQKAKIHYYNYQKNQKLDKYLLGEHALIYNICGYYKVPDSLVVSQEDQLNYLDGIIRQRKSEIPAQIENYLDEDKYYIFLGFDAQDWQLPMIFRRILHKEDKKLPQNHYIDSYQTEGATVDFYKATLDFNFVEGDALAFVQELKRRYKDWQIRNKEPILIRSVRYNQGEKTKNILFLTAQPKNTMAIELIEEFNQVENTLEQTKDKQNYNLKLALNVSTKKLLSKLLAYTPEVLHFSGHGIDKGLLLYGEKGYAELASAESFAKLLKQFKGIKCLFLNACYSDKIAETAAQFIPYVIGTIDTIGDEMAIGFSEAFYQALFSGETYEAAFKMAKAAAQLQNIKGDAPILFVNGQKTDVS